MKRAVHWLNQQRADTNVLLLFCSVWNMNMNMKINVYCTICRTFPMRPCGRIRGFISFNSASLLVQNDQPSLNQTIVSMSQVLKCLFQRLQPHADSFNSQDREENVFSHERSGCLCLFWWFPIPNTLASWLYASSFQDTPQHVYTLLPVKTYITPPLVKLLWQCNSFLIDKVQCCQNIIDQPPQDVSLKTTINLCKLYSDFD